MIFSLQRQNKQSISFKSSIMSSSWPMKGYVSCCMGRTHSMPVTAVDIRLICHSKIFDWDRSLERPKGWFFDFRWSLEYRFFKYSWRVLPFHRMGFFFFFWLYLTWNKCCNCKLDKCGFEWCWARRASFWLVVIGLCTNLWLLFSFHVFTILRASWPAINQYLMP